MGGTAAQPSLYRPDKNLSVGDLSLAGSEMPLYAHLLPLCGRSAEKTRALPGIMVIPSPYQPLPSLGRQRV